MDRIWVKREMVLALAASSAHNHKGCAGPGTNGSYLGISALAARILSSKGNYKHGLPGIQPKGLRQSGPNGTYLRYPMHCDDGIYCLPGEGRGPILTGLRCHENWAPASAGETRKEIAILAGAF